MPSTFQNTSSSTGYQLMTISDYICLTFSLIKHNAMKTNGIERYISTYS